MRQQTSHSFQALDPDEIEPADLLEQLVSSTSSRSHAKSGSETWACAWAPDNSYFAWSSGRRVLNLVPWDTKAQKRHDLANTDGLNGRKYHMIDCSEIIWSLAFGSADNVSTGNTGRHTVFSESLIIATGLASGKIKLWNCNKGILIIELLDHRDTVRCLDFTKDGSLQLSSASRDGSIKLWDLTNDGNMYKTLKFPNINFYGCTFSPNGKWVVGVGIAKSVYMWDRSCLNDVPLKFEGHHNDVVSCCFSPDSSLLATASYDTKVIIWNSYTRERLCALGHLFPSPRLIFAGGSNDHYVRQISFSRDGVTLASVCEDGFVRFWDLTDIKDPVSVASINEGVSCQFSTDGSVLAVGYRSGDVDFFASPSRVPRLNQLSRLAIRKAVVSDDVAVLPLPSKLVNFLKYQDLFQEQL